MHFPGLSCSGSGTRIVLRGADSVGLAFCALPRSKQLRWPGAWRAQSPPVEGWDLSSLRSCCSVFWVYNQHTTVCLLWGADLWLQPSWWMWTVQNPKKSWLATKPACSLVDDASLGPGLPPSGSGCPRLPVTGKGWPVCSRLALLSPLFCKQTWRCLRLELLAW